MMPMSPREVADRLAKDRAAPDKTRYWEVQCVERDREMIRLAEHFHDPEFELPPIGRSAAGVTPHYVKK